ncbi:hypothetical protein FQA39_LY03513 [Lamprigera yunnana]|nr:hypothetical protein FQA39_LY03513 [Lamprigera yunnana]
MLTKKFYNTVIVTEDTVTVFFREHHLLLDGDEVKLCTRCGNERREKEEEKEEEDEEEAEEEEEDEEEAEEEEEDEEEAEEEEE